MKEAFLRMKELLDQPEFTGILASHRSHDFDVCDFEALTRHGSPSSEYIWIVCSEGTRLHRLYVHAAVDACIEADLSSYIDARVFHVGRKFLHEVSFVQARALMARRDYSLHGDGRRKTVYHHGQAVARLEVSPRYVRCLSLGVLSHDQVAAIRTIGYAEARDVCHGWSGPGPFTLDGRDITARLITLCRECDQKVAVFEPA